ncbi:MAG: tetratricopeptide repeat protein [Bryobacteraceae bacterium]
MSVVRLFKYGVRFAAWVTPHIQRWQQERQVNQTESERHMKARNYPQAEQSLILHLEEAHRRRYAAKRKLNIWLDLADAQRYQGKQAEAGESFAGALKLIESNKPDSDCKSLYLDRWAQFEADRGNVEECCRAAQEAVDLTSSSKKPDLNLLAIRVHALAVAESRAGRGEESRATLRKAMNLYEQAYGPDHPDTAARLADLGEACRKEGKHDEAKQLLERALKVHQRSLGPTSPEAMRDLLHLAVVLEDSGDIPGAIQRYERALSVTEKIVGSKGADEIEILLGMGRLYVVSEHYPKAIETLDQALRHLSRTKDERVAGTYEKLAWCNRKLRRWKEAEKYYSSAIAMWKELPGTHDTEVKANLDAHVAMLRDLGRDEDADRLVEVAEPAAHAS